MLEFGFPCYAALHGGGTALESVYDGQRVIFLRRGLRRSLLLLCTTIGAKDVSSAVSCRVDAGGIGPERAHVC